MHDAPYTHDQDDRHCATGTHCAGYDSIAKHPAPVTATCPLCDPCLTAAGRDVAQLVVDWYDLEQMQLPSMSQATDSQPRGKAAPPMPLRGEPEALQAEILHVLTTWEAEVRAVARLHEPDPRVRRGTAVQRAVTVLHPRLRLLATLPATAVYPTGCEDDPTDMAGWEAVHHLQALRARARSMLGWTRRTHWLPGRCPNPACATHTTPPPDGPLYRSEPRYEGDTHDVHCDICATSRPAADYDTYVLTLTWPALGDVR